MTVTVLTDNTITVAEGAQVANGNLCVPGDEFEGITARSPVAGEALDAHSRDGRVNVSALWRHLQRPLLRDEAGQAWVLGASAGQRAAALESLRAPDFTLSDLDGRAHSLSDYRGKKVLLASWASW